MSFNQFDSLHLPQEKSENKRGFQDNIWVQIAEGLLVAAPIIGIGLAASSHSKGAASAVQEVATAARSSLAERPSWAAADALSSAELCPGLTMSKFADGRLRFHSVSSSVNVDIEPVRSRRANLYTVRASSSEFPAVLEMDTHGVKVTEPNQTAMTKGTDLWTTPTTGRQTYAQEANGPGYHLRASGRTGGHGGVDYYWAGSFGGHKLDETGLNNVPRINLTGDRLGTNLYVGPRSVSVDRFDFTRHFSFENPDLASGLQAALRRVS